MENKKTRLYKLFMIGFLVVLILGSALAAPKGIKKPASSSAIVTAPQFSGALYWAHKQGLKGTKETALVLESGTSFLKETIVTPPISDSKENSSLERRHAIGVTSIISQMAPQSIIVRVDRHNLSLPKIRAYSFAIRAAIRKASVVNYSAGTDAEWLNQFRYALLPNPDSSHAEEIKKSHDQRIENFLHLVSQEGIPKLLIVAAGNDRADLSKPATRLGKDWIYWDSNAYIQNEDLRKSVILAGALDTGFNLSRFSNFPGEDRHIQENFLCTLGQDILKMDIGHSSLESGTSFAAPIIAGAALLLKQKFPTFTSDQIKETLLESASKDFFTRDEYGYTTLIYDPSDGKPFIHQNEKSVSIFPFDPEVYGKGVLDLRAAFVYGDLLASSLLSTQGRKSPAELRREMKHILKAQEEAAAYKIQSGFQAYKEKKKKPKKSLKSFIRRLVKKK